MSLSDAIVANISITATDSASAVFARVGASARAAGAEVEAAGAKSSTSGWEKAATGVGKLSTGIGLLTVAAGVGAVDIAAHFDDMTMKVGNNTGMTNAQLEQLRQEVLKLGADSPAPLSDIAAGFEKAANAGFHGADAMKIVDASMRAAVETGGQTADVVDAVTGVLKNFKMPASDAGKALGELMTAAAQGDVRLPDLVTSFSKVANMAGSMHQPLNQTLADYSTLTRYTHDASVAQTEFAGMLSHILNPTSAAKTLMDGLARSTGVDLVTAFQKTAQGGENLGQLLTQVSAALHLNGQRAGEAAKVLGQYHAGTITAAQATAELDAKTQGAASKIMTLFGGMRGGLAALTLLTAGWKDHNSILGTINANYGLVDSQWKRTSADLSSQMGILKNDTEELGVAVGNTLVPAVTGAVKDMIPLAQATAAAAKAHPDLTKGAIEAGGALLGLSLAARGANFVLSPFGTSIGGVATRLIGLGAGMGVAEEGAVELGTGLAVPTAGLSLLIPVAVAGGVAAYELTGHFGTLTQSAEKVGVSQDNLYTALYKTGSAAIQTAAGLQPVSDGLSDMVRQSDGSVVSVQSLKDKLGQFGDVMTNQVVPGLKNFSDSAKNDFTQATTVISQSAATAHSQVVSHYDAMKQAVLASLLETKDQSTRLADEQKLAVIQKAEDEATGRVAAAARAQQGVIAKAMLAKDGVIQANLAQRSAVISSATEQEAAVIEKADTQAAGVITQSQKQHRGVATEAAVQKADSIRHAGEEAAGVIKQHEAKKLGVLAAARDLREKADKEGLAMAAGGIKNAESMSKGVTKAMADLSKDGSAKVVDLHSKVNTEIKGMATDVNADTKLMAQYAITNSQQMYQQIVGGSIVPDMHREVVAEMKAMAAESGAAAAVMKTLVAAQMEALASEASGYGRAVGANFASGLASEAGAVGAAASALVAAAQFHMAVHSPTLAGVDFFLYGQRAGEQFAQGLGSETGAVGAAAKQLIAQAQAELGKGLAGASSATASTGGSLPADMSQLAAAMKQLPPDFRTAGTDIVAGYQSQIGALQAKEVSDLKSAYADFLAKMKTAQQTSNEQLYHYLIDHSIRIDAANKSQLLSLQSLNSAYATQRAAELEQLKSATTKQAGVIEATLAKQKAIYDEHVAKLEAALGIKTSEQKQMLGEWLRNHQATLIQHEQKLLQGYDSHVTKLESTFQVHVDKLHTELSKLSMPGGLWDSLKKEVDTLAGSSLKALDQAILTGKGNLDQLTSTAAKAAEAQQHMTDVTEQGAIRLAVAMGDFTTAVDKAKSKVDSSLQQAIDKYTYDLIHHTGDLTADAQAIQQAQEQQDKYTAALASATSVADSQKTADASRTSALTAGTQALAGFTVMLGGARQGLLNLTQLPSDLASTLGRMGQAAVGVTQSFADLQNSAAARLKAALDQYALDLVNHTGNLTADALAIQQAQSAQDALTAAMNQANAVVTPLVTTFAGLQNAAQTLATSTLGDLAQKLYDVNHGISDTLPPLDVLRQRADDAARSASGLADAMSSATSMVNQDTAATMGLYNSQVAAAQAAYDSALAAYENADAAGVSGSALQSLHDAAVAAGVALGQLQQIATSVANDVQKILNPTTAAASTPTFASAPSAPSSSGFPSTPSGSGGTAGSSTSNSSGSSGTSGATTPSTAPSSGSGGLSQAAITAAETAAAAVVKSETGVLSFVNQMLQGASQAQLQAALLTMQGLSAADKQMLQAAATGQESAAQVMQAAEMQLQTQMAAIQTAYSQASAFSSTVTAFGSAVTQFSAAVSGGRGSSGGSGGDQSSQAAMDAAKKSQQQQYYAAMATGMTATAYDASQGVYDIQGANGGITSQFTPPAPGTYQQVPVSTQMINGIQYAIDQFGNPIVGGYSAATAQGQTASQFLQTQVYTGLANIQQNFNAAYSAPGSPSSPDSTTGLFVAGQGQTLTPGQQQWNASVQAGLINYNQSTGQWTGTNGEVYSYPGEFITNPVANPAVPGGYIPNPALSAEFGNQYDYGILGGGPINPTSLPWDILQAQYGSQVNATPLQVAEQAALGDAASAQAGQQWAAAALAAGYNPEGQIGLGSGLAQFGGPTGVPSGVGAGLGTGSSAPTTTNPASYQNDPIYVQLKAIYDQLVGLNSTTKQAASAADNADVVKWLRDLYALEKAGKGGVGPGTDWAAWLRNLGLSSVSLLTSAAV